MERRNSINNHDEKFVIEELYPKETALLRKNFKELPASEHVLIWYGCSLQNSTLGGYLYLTPKFVAYCASLGSAAVLLPLDKMTSIDKEKKNCISFKFMKETEETSVLFTGFYNRNETYDLIIRLSNVLGKSEIDKTHVLHSFKYVKENNTFHELFPLVDPYEVVIEHYSCSTDTSLLTGRLYITNNYKLYYTATMSSVKEIIPFDSIKSLEKSGKLVSGIDIITENKTYQFRGFFAFESAWNMINELFQQYSNRPAVFGVDIGKLADREGRRIPTFLVETIDYIENNLLSTQGIFRISASSMVQTRIQNAIDRGQQIDWTEYNDPHLAPNLLKKFFRDSPTPLIPYEIYNCFIMLSATIPNIQDDPELLKAKLKNALDLMPTKNRMILAKLCKFLTHVSEKSDANMMGLSNLATIWGPLLLKSESESNVLVNPESLNEVKQSVDLVKLLILHSDSIFEIESIRTKEKVSTEKGRYDQLSKVLTGQFDVDNSSDAKDKYKVKDKYHSGVLSDMSDRASKRRSTSSMLREKFRKDTKTGLLRPADDKQVTKSDEQSSTEPSTDSNNQPSKNESADPPKPDNQSTEAIDVKNSPAPKRPPPPIPSQKN